MASAVLMTIMKKRRKQWWVYSAQSRDDRRAVLGETADEYIKQGKLGKRGARIGDAWNPRWVCLSPEELTYGYYEEATHTPGAIIDCIPVEEISDVVPEMDLDAQQSDGDGDGSDLSHEDRRAKFLEQAKMAVSRRDILARIVSQKCGACHQLATAPAVSHCMSALARHLRLRLHDPNERGGRQGGTQVSISGLLKS